MAKIDSDWSWKPTTPAKAARRSRRSRTGFQDLPWTPMKARGMLRGSRNSSDTEGEKKLEEVVGKIIREDLYNCGFCGGKGQRPPGSTCPVCKGKGQISMNPPALRCAFCKGRGEAQPRSLITCRICKGKGIVKIVEPIKLCLECGGRGHIASGSETPPCKRCKGKGIVTAGDERKIFLPNPSGSERDIAEAVYQLGGEASVAEISPRARISTAYTEYVCKSMANKGYLEKVGRTVYVLTPECEEALEQKEVGDLERVSPEQKEILEIVRDGGEGTPKEIADRMGIRDVSYITKRCKSMGKEDLVDVLLSGKIVIAPKGERVLER